MTIARDGPRRSSASDRRSFDLVLLDVMLPEDVRARRLPERSGRSSSVPIIMVTAKSTEIDTVVGLEVGADDYVAKPYRLRELVSRMRAVLRRARPRGRAPCAERDRGGEPSRHRRGPARRRRRPNVLEVGRDPPRPRPPRVHRPRRGGPAPPEGVRAARAAARRAPAGSSPGTRSSTGSGASTTSATRRPSTSTSSGSAPASRWTPPSRTLITTIRGLGYRFESPRSR